MKFDMTIEVAHKMGGFKTYKFTVNGKDEHSARRKTIEKFLLSGYQVKTILVKRIHV